MKPNQVDIHHQQLVVKQQHMVVSKTPYNFAMNTREGLLKTTLENRVRPA